MESPPHRRRFEPLFLACLLLLLTTGIVVYSQTRAFAWDEGFHLLIAQLIKRGRKPYIDFVFSQTPLNAYWNAFWMSFFGETWRVPHAVAALSTGGALALVAGFVWNGFPEPQWRFPATILVASLVGLNVLVVRYGGIAQAYGLCLLMTVAAFRAAVAAVERGGVIAPLVAGLACGIAAGSSLLTAPVGPVLLVWILVCNQTGSRPAKLAAFILAEVTAFIPVLWLFALSPGRVWFGVVDYNFRYRLLDWPGATRQNFEVLISWIDSGPTLLLLLLAAGGLLFVRFRSPWEPARKREFYLCAWLAIVICLHLSTARPTFARYYVFAVPFLGILATVGVYAAGSSLYHPDRPWQPVVLAALLAAIGLTKALYDERDDMEWHDLEITAAKVREVTKPAQTLDADEAIYFLTGHPPPSGMEMRDSHKFRFPPGRDAFLHVIPQPELDRQVKAGAFDTLETCSGDDFIGEHGYAVEYAQSADAGECKVFWEKKN